MKTMKWILFIVAIIFFPTWSHPSNLGTLRISLIEGDVQINTEDTGGWAPASLNMPLQDGDRIWVPEEGRAELQLRDGTVLRLDERTALDILTLDQDSYQFYLAEGRAYANFRGGRGTVLQIDTPMSSVRAYERALFQIHILDDRHTDISVFQGSVYTESQDGRVRVDPNKTLALSEGFPAELFPLGPPDDWERWNENRDRIVAERRAPSRYLPEELHPYSSDFDHYGRWVHVREYGYVWTPTVIVSAGWAPYRVGRWVWIRGDYVWISYEPWGWVPYHYGRWAFVARVGWCWVPPPRGAVFWGPGFVGWVRTPTYVSWVPLAPREIYYGYGYYGPYSVNITQINISTVHVEKVVYRNVHVRNAVTVVHHDTFVHGRKVEVNVRENPFLREKIHIGRPNIKPERNTVMPVVREIPHGKRPPEKIDHIRVREIKERRPLTREREVSVFRPESPPREMEIKRREGRPQERERIRMEEPQKEKRAPMERRPAMREPEKPIEQKPIERIEKPVEPKPTEKGRERTGDAPSPRKETEKAPEIRQQDKPIERRIDKSPRSRMEPSGEDRRPMESEKGPSRVTSPSDRGSVPVRSKEIQRPPEKSAPERERPIEREVRPERGNQREQEGTRSRTEVQRPEEPSSVEGERGRSREPKPQRDTPSGRERRP